MTELERLTQALYEADDARAKAYEHSTCDEPEWWTCEACKTQDRAALTVVKAAAAIIKHLRNRRPR